MAETKIAPPTVETKCYHCQEKVVTPDIVFDDHAFCCTGCKTVYQILSEHALCDFYQISDNPGFNQKSAKEVSYDYLDDVDIRVKLLDFEQGNRAKISFLLPQIHCASCVWLLEQLPRIQSGVISSRIDFMKRAVHIDFDPTMLKIQDIANLLHSLGYPPDISRKLNEKRKEPYTNGLGFRIGVAGFAFGNIMLFSFPEYLGLEEGVFKAWFGYLNLLLSIPVLFFSGWSYLVSGWHSLRRWDINIDVPLALGMVVLFVRSAYEIISGTGAGYMDSLAGLIFFLLIGRWYQGRTYGHLSFDRDFRSYFPISIERLAEGGAQSERIPVEKIGIGDLLRIRNQEIIPVDSILHSDLALIDYSFVTGEAEPVAVVKGEKIFAGGKLQGAAITVLATKKVENSYLVRLWEQSGGTEYFKHSHKNITDQFSKYFTGIIVLISLLTFIYWYGKDVTQAWLSMTAVLIIACPCAIALAVPFIQGNVVRILGKRGIFLKGNQVLNALARLDTVAFDKTGTLTEDTDRKLYYHGRQMNAQERACVHAVAFQSTHPLSIAIEKQLRHTEIRTVSSYREVVGKGTSAEVDGHQIRLGSPQWIAPEMDMPENKSYVFIEIDGQVYGYYEFQHAFRRELPQVVADLERVYDLALISGDSDQDAYYLRKYFGADTPFYFRQKPEDKISIIQKWQSESKIVAMIGDGLNDAAALRQSDVGIVMADESNNFTPNCDIIYNAKAFGYLPNFLKKARGTERLILGAYGFAILYNIVGLSFAVTGQMSPVIAAILMPLSSLTIVTYAMLSTQWYWRSLRNQKTTED